MVIAGRCSCLACPWQGLSSPSPSSHEGTRHSSRGCMRAVQLCTQTKSSWGGKGREGEEGGGEGLAGRHTVRFGSTAKVLAKCRLKYYRISECH